MKLLIVFAAIALATVLAAPGSWQDSYEHRNVPVIVRKQPVLQKVIVERRIPIVQKVIVERPVPVLKKVIVEKQIPIIKKIIDVSPRRVVVVNKPSSLDYGNYGRGLEYGK